VRAWKAGHDFRLPKSPSPDLPFRMCIVIEADGDVLPLQQCTEARFEETDIVESGAWLRDPRSLVGAFEPTPVSVQLDAELKLHTNLDALRGVGQVRGPLRRLVLTVLQPYCKFRIFCRARRKGVDTTEQLLEEVTEFEHPTFKPTRSVILGTSKVTARWIVVYGAEFPITRRTFYGAVYSISQTAEITHWCIVWGRKPAEERRVVSIFSSKWMVYDKYGQFTFGRPQSSAPSLAPAADATSFGGAQEGPVPNTEYKKGIGDPKATIRDVDELVLTPEALDYYQELYIKRKGRGRTRL
jgi:hypothetical protein